jgi:hypothetical protein
MKLWCPVLIGLLLLTVIPQASAQDKERIVVGLENESLIP